MSKINLGRLGLLGMMLLFISFTFVVAQEPSYNSISEWNGPYYHVLNASGAYAQGNVDSPVIDNPFVNPTAIAVWTFGGIYYSAVVDATNDRIQFFRSDIFQDSESAFTWNAVAAAAPGDFDSNEIWFNPGATNSIVPGSEKLYIDNELYSRVSDLTGYTSSDLVYKMTYQPAGAHRGKADLPAGSLSSTSDIYIEYVNSTSATVGTGDIDYLKSGGVAAGAPPAGATLQIDEVYPDDDPLAPDAFENLTSIAVNGNTTPGSIDIYAVDAGSPTEKLFTYTITPTGTVFQWIATYSGPLSNPMDVDVEEEVEGANNILYTDDVTQLPGANDPQLSTAILNNMLITNHTYIFTVLTTNTANPLVLDGLSFSVEDASTNNIIGYIFFPAGTGAGPVNVDDIIPGLRLTFTADALAGTAPTAGETITLGPDDEAYISEYIFLCDTDNDRIKIIKGADNGDNNGLVQNYFAGTQRMDVYWVSDGASAHKSFVSACRAEENSFGLYTGNPYSGAPGTWTQWTKVDNFAGSTPSDNHYMYDYDNQVIMLGDGFFGAIPSAGDTVFAVYNESIDVLDYGTVGSGSGQFNLPQGITAHYNLNHDWYELYISDTGNDRIVKLLFYPGDLSLPGSASIDWVTSWNTVTSASDYLENPSDIAFETDGSGNLYLFVCDTGNDRVVVYHDAEAEAGGGGGSSAPTYSNIFGTTGNGLGQFNNPIGISAIAYGTDIDIYVCDSQNGWVNKFQEGAPPILDLDYSDLLLGTIYPASGSYTFNATGATFATNASTGSYVKFFYSDSLNATNPIACSNQEVSPDASSFTWTFSQTPSGALTTGTYYLYAKLYNANDVMLDEDNSSALEKLEVSSEVQQGVSSFDPLDDDRFLYLQNSAERLVNITVDYPDSVSAVSFAGTFSATLLEIIELSEGPAWQNLQNSGTIFNGTFDNIDGTFSISSSVLGSNTGLTESGKAVAIIKVKARSTAITVVNRSAYSSFNLTSASMTDYKGSAISSPAYNDLYLRLGYLGDIARPDSAGGSVPNKRPCPDGIIGYNDLITFTLGWNGLGGEKDPIADLGPTTGTVPNLIPQPDGKWDVYDLVAFTQMFSWYLGQSFEGFGIPEVIAFGGGANSTIIGEAVRNGNRLDLTLSANGVVDLMCANLKVNFNPALCSLLEATEGDFLRGNANSFFRYAENGGAVEIYQARFDGISPSVSGVGDLAVLSFEVADDFNGEFTVVYDLRNSAGAVIESGNALIADAGLPETYSLGQNHPNPFNPETTIDFTLPVSSHIKLEVFNTVGQKVATLYDGFCQSGYHHVVWKGMDDKGKDLSSGVYFYALRAGNFQTMRKMILMK